MNRADILAGLAEALRRHTDSAGTNRDHRSLADEVVTAIEQVTAPSPTPGGLRVRPAVVWFAQQMEERLSRHDHDRGPDGWVGNAHDDLLGRLDDERSELQEAVFSCEGTKEKIQLEAADVANFAMMIAHNAAGNPEAALAAPVAAGVEGVKLAPDLSALRDIASNMHTEVEFAGSDFFRSPLILEWANSIDEAVKEWEARDILKPREQCWCSRCDKPLKKDDDVAYTYTHLSCQPTPASAGLVSAVEDACRGIRLWAETALVGKCKEYGEVFLEKIERLEAALAQPKLVAIATQEVVRLGDIAAAGLDERSSQESRDEIRTELEAALTKLKALEKD